MKYDFTSIIDRTGCGSLKWRDGENASTENVPLSVADMEFYAAPPITKAIQRTAETMVLGYTTPTDAYYEAVCNWMLKRHNFPVKKEWILTTPGVVNALAVLVDAATKPGESVLILTPVYYPFDMAVLAKGRKIVYSKLINRDGRYEIDYADLQRKAKRPDVKAMLFCNPHNPVGRVWTREELQLVADICCNNGVFIIDDEIHNDLIMPGYEHTVMATLSGRVADNIAVCTAPSKTFNIAGLQCSNIIIPNKTMRTVAFTCSYLNMQTSLNIFAYAACTAAYNECEDWLEEALHVIHGNAEYIECFLAENIPEIKASPLEGTYLLWLDLRALGMNHVEQKKMLLDANLYLDNGEMFGDEGRGFQRINIACARETIEKAMLRLKAGVERVRADWEANGKPMHTTLRVGEALTDFVYTSAAGTDVQLSEAIAKPTLLVFARFYECGITKLLLKLLKAAYPIMKRANYDVKVILQSDVQTVAEGQHNYPFELIADRNAVLYDRYNVFEANSFVNMAAGDKTVERLIGKDLKRVIYTDKFASMSDTVMTALGGAPAENDGRRDLQLCAFAAVQKDMRITYAHYCKTIADFPDVKALLKGLKG